MKKRNQIKFFKKYNEDQNLKKEKLYEQFFYYISLFVIQLGFLGYYILNLPDKQNNIVWYIFFILGFGVLVVFVFILVKIYKFIFDGQYASLAEPKQFKVYFEKVRNSKLSKKKKKKEYRDYFLEIFSDAAQKNRETNKIRQKSVIWIRNLLVGNIIILFIMFIPYFLLMGEKLNSYKVLIINDQLKMEENISNIVKIEDINKKILFDTNISRRLKKNDLSNVQIEKDIIINQKKGKVMSDKTNDDTEENIVESNDNSSNSNLEYTESNNTENEQDFGRPPLEVSNESFDN